MLELGLPGKGGTGLDLLAADEQPENLVKHNLHLPDHPAHHISRMHVDRADRHHLVVQVRVKNKKIKTFWRSPLLRDPRRQAMSMLSCPICFL